MKSFSSNDLIPQRKQWNKDVREVKIKEATLTPRKLELMTPRSPVRSAQNTPRRLEPLPDSRQDKLKQRQELAEHVAEMEREKRKQRQEFLKLKEAEKKQMEEEKRYISKFEISDSFN